MVATEGRLDCAGDGAMVATMADNLSSFLSKSRNLLGVWPSLRAFAGRLRATCSTHSTLAFWHLGTCHSMWSSGRGSSKHTFGRCWGYPTGRSELCVFDIARRQRRSLSFLLLPPWWEQRWQSWEKESHRPPVARSRSRSCGEVRSCAKSGVRLHV